jgi:hypothetical protein
MAVTTVFKLVRWGAALAVGLVGTSMLLYAGGTGYDPSARSYSFFRNSLSDLGATVAWGGRPNRLGAALFVAGFGLFAITCVAALVALVRLYSASHAARPAAVLAAGVGIFSAGSLLATALTPQDRHPALHGQLTRLALVAVILAALLLALATARDERLPRRVPGGWLALAAVVLGWAWITSWQPTSELALALPPTLQKVVAAALLAVLIFQTREAERLIARAERPPV